MPRVYLKLAHVIHCFTTYATRRNIGLNVAVFTAKVDGMVEERESEIVCKPLIYLVFQLV